MSIRTKQQTDCIDSSSVFRRSAAFTLIFSITMSRFSLSFCARARASASIFTRSFFRRNSDSCSTVSDKTWQQWDGCEQKLWSFNMAPYSTSYLKRHYAVSSDVDTGTEDSQSPEPSDITSEHHKPSRPQQTSQVKPSQLSNHAGLPNPEKSAGLPGLHKVPAK